MPEINIADARNRDARVQASSVTTQNIVRWLDEDGQTATNRKILRATMPHDLDALLAANDDDLEKVAQALVAGDPEIDIEAYGATLTETSRVYVNSENQIVHRVTRFDVIIDPEGNLVEKRPRKPIDSNVSVEIPLTWTGRKMPKKKIFNQFFFTGLLQITHVNGLTYDFLYDMANELHEEEALMLLGAGKGGKERLVFRRNTPEYTGFLEGRIDGDKYALLLHLTNMELKDPTPEEDETESKDSKEAADV